MNKSERETRRGAEQIPAAKADEEQNQDDLATIDIHEAVKLLAVANAAREWAQFQSAESKRYQRADRRVGDKAREAEERLLAAVQAMG